MVGIAVEEVHGSARVHKQSISTLREPVDDVRLLFEERFSRCGLRKPVAEE